jgi:hypothetical protein
VCKMRETINLQPLRTTLSNNFCVSLTSPYSISSHSFTLYATSFNTTLPSSTIVSPYSISSHAFTLFATFFNEFKPPSSQLLFFLKNITTLLFIISFAIFISPHSFTRFAIFFNTTLPSSTSSNPHHHNSFFLFCQVYDSKVALN